MGGRPAPGSASAPGHLGLQGLRSAPRQGQHRHQTAFGAVAQHKITAVAARDVARDAQAQAGAAGGPAARSLKAEEGLEDLLELGLGDARAVVEHLHFQPLGVVMQLDRGAAAVGAGVVDQVAQRALEQRGIGHAGRGGPAFGVQGTAHRRVVGLQRGQQAR